MTRNMLFGVFVVLLIAADYKKDEKSDLQQLQGTWILVRLERDGKALPDNEVPKTKLTVGGNKYTTKEEKSAVGFGEVIELNQSAKPKTIDFKFSETIGEKGIYLLDGDTLKICRVPMFGEFAGNKNRPAEFSTKKDSNHVLEVWKRKKQ